jgi:hypothetical protein
MEVNDLINFLNKRFNFEFRTEDSKDQVWSAHLDLYADNTFLGSIIHPKEFAMDLGTLHGVSLKTDFYDQVIKPIGIKPPEKDFAKFAIIESLGMYEALVKQLLEKNKMI